MIPRTTFGLWSFKLQPNVFRASFSFVRKLRAVQVDSRLLLMSFDLQARGDNTRQISERMLDEVINKLFFKLWAVGIVVVFGYISMWYKQSAQVVAGLKILLFFILSIASPTYTSRIIYQSACFTKDGHRFRTTGLLPSLGSAHFTSWTRFYAQSRTSWESDARTERGSRKRHRDFYFAGLVHV